MKLAGTTNPCISLLQTADMRPCQCRWITNALVHVPRREGTLSDLQEIAAQFQTLPDIYRGHEGPIDQLWDNLVIVTWPWAITSVDNTLAGAKKKLEDTSCKLQKTPT